MNTDDPGTQLTARLENSGTGQRNRESDGGKNSNSPNPRLALNRYHQRSRTDSTVLANTTNNTRILILLGRRCLSGPGS